MVDPDTAELVDLPFIDEVIPYDKGMPLLPVLKKYGDMMWPYCWILNIVVLGFHF